MERNILRSKRLQPISAQSNKLKPVVLRKGDANPLLNKHKQTVPSLQSHSQREQVGIIPLQPRPENQLKQQQKRPYFQISNEPQHAFQRQFLGFSPWITNIR